MFFQGAPYQQGKDGKTLVYYGVTPFLVVVPNPGIMLQTFHWSTRGCVVHQKLNEVVVTGRPCWLPRWRGTPTESQNEFPIRKLIHLEQALPWKIPTLYMCDLSLTGWPQIFTAWKEDILPGNSDSKFPWQSFHDKAKVRTEFWQSHKTDRCHWLQSSDHLDYDDDEDNDDGNDDDDNCKCNENDDHNYMNECHYSCIMWLCPIWLNHWTKMLKWFFPHQSLCYPLLHRCQCFSWRATSRSYISYLCSWHVSSSCARSGHVNCETCHMNVKKLVLKRPPHKSL